jgi:hypothetical protein
LLARARRAKKMTTKEMKNRAEMEIAWEGAMSELLDNIDKFRELVESGPGVEDKELNWGHVGTISRMNHDMSELIDAAFSYLSPDSDILEKDTE